MAPPEREAEQFFVIHPNLTECAPPPQPAYTLAQEKFGCARNFPLPSRDAGVFAALTTCCAQVWLLRVASVIGTPCCRGEFYYEELACASLA